MISVFYLNPGKTRLKRGKAPKTWLERKLIAFLAATEKVIISIKVGLMVMMTVISSQTLIASLLSTGSSMHTERIWRFL